DLDDIQKELDQIGAGSSVDSELAALKAQAGLSAPPAPAALGTGGAVPADQSTSDQAPADQPS
ncbi:MAG: PspA/IM30 family protein, partial [Actinomycetota bacterium]|nr:PspA/IM30 family protein [Actinomycetota bacterium]